VELTPGTEYTVAVTGLQNVVGLVGDSQATFTAPEPPEAPPAADEPEEQPADTVPQPEPLPGAEPDPEPELE